VLPRTVPGSRVHTRVEPRVSSLKRLGHSGCTITRMRSSRGSSASFWPCWRLTSAAAARAQLLLATTAGDRLLLRTPSWRTPPARARGHLALAAHWRVAGTGRCAAERGLAEPGLDAGSRRSKPPLAPKVLFAAARATAEGSQLRARQLRVRWRGSDRAPRLHAPRTSRRRRRTGRDADRELPPADSYLCVLGGRRHRADHAHAAGSRWGRRAHVQRPARPFRAGEHITRGASAFPAEVSIA